MKNALYLLMFLLPFLLTACGGCDDFHGRYTDDNGTTSYTFLPEGELLITMQDREIKAHYRYDADAQQIRLTADETLPSEHLQLAEDGSLKQGSTLLTRAADTSLLAESTWIGDQGEYTFSLTFTHTEEGLQTFSELVTYHDDDMTYISQTDDSMTRLIGNKLFLDRTQYTVSEVTDSSLKLSIGAQSMIITKFPKGTAVKYRQGYTNIDDE